MYLKHDEIGMTKDQYLRMCEQTGEEIDWERCPPDLEDFPDSVYAGMSIFNSLGNRVFGDVGFVGKDYTNLDLLYKQYYIEEHEKEWLFEILLFLESKSIEQSQRHIKVEMDKIKKK